MTRRGNGPGRGGPASGRDAQPYEHGNVAALKHGAHSPRLVGAQAVKLLERIAADAPPWLEQVDETALREWSYAEARCELLRAWLDEHGQLDEFGKPRDAAKFLLSCEGRAARARRALGFDPLSRAQLGRDTAIAKAVASDNLRHIAERGRRVLDARAIALRAAQPSGPDDDGSDVA